VAPICSPDQILCRPLDETYIRIRGHWFYLYRALDSTGATIDFFLSAVRSAEAAKALFSKLLSDPSLRLCAANMANMVVRKRGAPDGLQTDAAANRTFEASAENEIL
jgi:transposase-like protein